MPQLGAKPPGGKRISKAEKLRRQHRVEQLMLLGTSRKELVHCMGVEFRCRPRTVDDYIAAVRQTWAEAAAARRPHERELALRRIENLAKKLEETGAWGPRVALERLRADVCGLRHYARPEEPPRPELRFAELTLEQAEARAKAALHAIRSAQRRRDEGGLDGRPVIGQPVGFAVESS